METPSADRSGIECPACGCPESFVVWTKKRTVERQGQTIHKKYRGRECEHCGRRYTTNERVVSPARDHDSRSGTDFRKAG